MNVLPLFTSQKRFTVWISTFFWKTGRSNRPPRGPAASDGQPAGATPLDNLWHPAQPPLPGLCPPDQLAVSSRQQSWPSPLGPRSSVPHPHPSMCSGSPGGLLSRFPLQPQPLPLLPDPPSLSLTLPPASTVTHTFPFTSPVPSQVAGRVAESSPCHQKPARGLACHGCSRSGEHVA